MEVCPIHNQVWKTVPAGVSKKTGRPYASFQTCTVEGCTQRPEYQAKAPIATPTAPVRDTGAQIAMMNSITNAVAFYDPYRTGDMAKDLTQVGELALKFYNKIREAK